MDRTQQCNRIQSIRIMSLRNYKCRTFTSLQWTHPVRQTQRMDLLVNLYSQWKSVSLHCTGLCYCFRSYRGTFGILWEYSFCLCLVTLYILVDMSLNQVASCLTKLNGFTSCKTLIFTVSVLHCRALRHR